MCADGQFEQAAAEARRSTRLCARLHHVARSSGAIRLPVLLVLRSSERRSIEGISRIGMRATGTFRVLGGRSFSSAISTRARARFLSRLFTRAKSSILRPSHASFLPGTVNRVKDHVSHRKQRIGYTLTRNVPAPPRYSTSCDDNSSASSRMRRRSSFPVPSCGNSSTAKNWFGRGVQRFGRPDCGN
jgi:hypothetical protein